VELVAHQLVEDFSEGLFWLPVWHKQLPNLVIYCVLCLLICTEYSNDTCQL
jgi:hypothetical protein